jgi:aminoglycoside phosphotransferase
LSDLTIARRQLPPALTAMIGDAAWQEVRIGWSGVSVFRLSGGRYLKVAERPHDLAPEQARLVWLQGQLPVPEPLYFADDGPRQFLLTTEIPGLPSFDDHFRDQRPRIVERLAEGLRLIHSVTRDDCPFDQRLAVMVDAAYRRLIAGRVDEKDFDPLRQGRTVGEAFDRLRATRPKEEDLVFAHGDYCLPNLLIDADTLAVNGFVDLGLAGISDRYRDLALAARSITYNFGEKWVATFFAAYGLAEVDHARIAFYQLLDEFF